MRIPTNTRMLRLRKDSTSPSSSSSTSGGSCPLPPVPTTGQFLTLPPIMRSSSSSSGQSSSLSSSSSSTGISLLKEDLRVEEEFQIVKTLSETGSFGKIVLATLKKDVTRAKVVIKARTCSLSATVDDFNREVEVTYLLSPHPNVITCYNVTFLWDAALCFLQEYAPYGSLHDFLHRRRLTKSPTSSSTRRVGETKTKLLCSQVASALEFMHQLHLVHGAVTPHNILIFKANLSLVKLADFSSTRPEGSLVVMTGGQVTTTASFNPPELCELLPQEKYHVEKALDSWQLGILLSYLLQKNKAPWAEADVWEDPCYRAYLGWLKKKSLKIPEPLRNCTPRFIRLFKRLCEPKPCQRSGVRELRKYLKDPWLLKKSCSAPIVRRTSDALSVDSTSEEIGHHHHSSDDVVVITSLEKLSLLNPPHPEKVDKERNLKEWVNKSVSTTPVLVK